MANETVKHKDAKMLGLMVLLVATVVPSERDSQQCFQAVGLVWTGFTECRQ